MHQTLFLFFSTYVHFAKMASHTQKQQKNVEVGTLCLTGDICLFVVRRHVLGQEMTQFE